MPVILVLDTSSTQAGLISSLIKATCATHWQLQGFIIKVVVLEFEHYTDYHCQWLWGSFRIDSTVWKLQLALASVCHFTILMPVLYIAARKFQTQVELQVELGREA